MMEKDMGSNQATTSVASNVASSQDKTNGLHVAIVLPVHNEQDNIVAVVKEIIDVAKSAGYRPSLVLVDDGSTDGTLEAIRSISTKNPCVRYIAFSRNFGKEVAIMAGLWEAGDNFDLLAYMDSDGQHDPADLVAMIDVMTREDVQMVCGARVDRSYQSRRQRWMARRFYEIFHVLGSHRIEEGVGDFNVLAPEVVRTIREFKEEHIFMKGLISWIGFRRLIHPIRIRPRAGGTPTSSSRKMLSLAIGAVLSFSSWPLRVWSLVGMASAFVALLYLTVVVLQTILMGRDVPGYATTVVLILGIGGLQLFSVGILGEYVARVYDASKKRPLYIVSERG